MIRNRWAILSVVAQIVAAMIVVDTPTGSDWLVAGILFASAMVTLAGFFRIEGWD